jgi:hypothetical protein
MDSTEYAQQQEMTALQSIYGDDFIEVPPPKAWKVSAASGAAGPLLISLAGRRAAPRVYRARIASGA